MISISYIEQTQGSLFHGKHNDTYIIHRTDAR